SGENGQCRSITGRDCGRSLNRSAALSACNSHGPDLDLAVESKIPNRSITKAAKNFDFLKHTFRFLHLASNPANVYYGRAILLRRKSFMTTIKRRAFMRSASLATAGFALASKYSPRVFA